MPRTVKTIAFQFTSATVMVAPMEIGINVNLDDHDIGSTENVRIVRETSQIDLTEGIANQVLWSGINKESVKGLAEVSEVTARISGLGIDVNEKFVIQIRGVDIISRRSVIIHMPKCKFVSSRATSVLTNKRQILEFDAFVPAPSDSGYSSNFTRPFSVFTPDDYSKIGLKPK